MGHVPALPLSSCVAMPQFPHLQSRDNMASLSHRDDEVAPSELELGELGTITAATVVTKR